MKTVRIGGAAAMLADSTVAVSQLLTRGGPLDYLVFDNLAEAIMPLLGRRMQDGQGPGYVEGFVDEQVLPNLAELLERKIKVVANAGGLDPQACADHLRRGAAELGLNPRIAAIVGDNLTERLGDYVRPGTRDMFDGSDVHAAVAGADRVLSLAAYTGAFPIAAALDAGADIVIAGRCVDSAPALGALIHEFGWDSEDFDQLAAGTLAGHLLECSIQATGGFFTDWREVPGWDDIGFPIAECSADGTIVLTKPPGTGGLVSCATVAEQMLYEVSDPARYIVPDVIMDVSHVTLTQESNDRVRLDGVRGRGRPATFKISMTYDKGWRAQFLYPVVGREAVDRAERLGREFLTRASSLLRASQLPACEGTQVDVVGERRQTYGEAIVRVVADHADIRGAQLIAREQSSLGMLAVGTSLNLGTTVKPIQWIASFLVPREQIALEVILDGVRIPHEMPAGGVDLPGSTPPAAPIPPAERELDAQVSLAELAWTRSGDKGDLFNVAVIARREDYLSYISAALTPEALAEFYTVRFASPVALKAQRFEVPGVSAMNFVVFASMEGGMMASRRLDPGAKGYGQILLDFPIPVPMRLLHSL